MPEVTVASKWPKWSKQVKLETTIMTLHALPQVKTVNYHIMIH